MLYPPCVTSCQTCLTKQRIVAFLWRKLKSHLFSSLYSHPITPSPPLNPSPLVVFSFFPSFFFSKRIESDCTLQVDVNIETTGCLAGVMFSHCLMCTVCLEYSPLRNQVIQHPLILQIIYQNLSFPAVLLCVCVCVCVCVLSLIHI